MDDRHALTPKQQAFVEEYLVDLNATQAAIRAGYSRDTARQIASENLARPDVQEAIAEARAARSTRTGVTSDQVVAELARISFSDLRKLFTPDGKLLPPGEWGDVAAAAVASMEVEKRIEGRGDDAETFYVTKLRLWDKNSALEKLARHLGLFEKDNAQIGAASLVAAIEAGRKRASRTEG